MPAVEQMVKEKQVVIFNLGNQIYGVDIKNVVEIIRHEAITTVPGNADFIEGIIKLRGRIIPLVDLSKQLIGSACQFMDSARIIVAEAGSVKIGMIVDSVSEVLRFSTEQIEPTPDILLSKTFYLEGVVLIDDRLVILLDLDRLIGQQDKGLLKGDIN